ncbi:carboxypeptidase-like regulatory domain-containing protein [Pontibacter amylolyticus]|uniref:carboxypeptidase-like regulatory domain-containing protein n=1 Tax=Pontibacter amylolyticus TaxID=1424080 RepID=UPI001667B4EB|nr:carboxypeptidase-like regulatory domain-containing protein [Pontibacter amylolyticus]
MPKSKLTRLLITFFFLLTCSVSFGQGLQISGTVRSAARHEAIPYVNIGIKKKNIGTATRPDGSFKITLKEENRQDTLTFSAIGYKELSLPVASILSGSMTVFELTEKRRHCVKWSSAARRLRSKNLVPHRAIRSCTAPRKRFTRTIFRN